MIYVGGTLVSWTSKKQATVSRSSTEAEYRGITTMVQELEWIKSIIMELSINVELPLKVKCDNLGATYFTLINPIYHAKTKHMVIV